MSFTFSGESAKDLYYGGKKIAKAYKGDTLVHVAYDPSDITPGLLDLNMTEYVLPPKVTEIKRYPHGSRGVFWGGNKSQITVYTKHPYVPGLKKGVTATSAYNVVYNSLKTDPNPHRLDVKYFTGGLYELVIPETVINIKTDCFAGFFDLKKIQLHENLKSIGSFAFYGCSIKEVILPSTMTNIFNNAFENTEALRTITLPQSCQIWQEAFLGCGVESLSIPQGVRFSSKYDETDDEDIDAFKDCKNLKSVTWENGCSLISSQFKGCSALTTLNIPESVHTIRLNDIGIESFHVRKSYESVSITYCSNLKSITYDDGCTRSGCFGKSNIKTIHFPKSLTVIQHNAFRESALEELGLEQPPDVECRIVGTAFMKNHNLKKLHIKSGNYVFADKENYEDNTTSFDGSFEACDSLEEVIIDDGVYGKFDSIINHLFKDCTSIKKARIPSTFDVGNRMFSGCSSLTELTLYSTIYSTNAFENCTALEMVEFPEGTESLPTQLLYGCTSLKTIILPSSIKRISYPYNDEDTDGAFEGCTSLTDIYCNFEKGKVSGAPWGAPKSVTIHYNSTGPEEE